MKYSVTFYPEKRGQLVDNVPLIMAVTYADKQKMLYYTGKRADRIRWDFEKHRLKINQITKDGQTSAKFNKELKFIEDSFDELMVTYEDEAPAPDVLREALKRKLGKITATPVPEKNLYDYFQSYIDLSENSISRIRTFRSVLLKMKKDQPAATFLTFDLKKFADSLTVQPNSVNTYLNALKTVFTYFVKKKIVTLNPFNDFEIPPAYYSKPYYLTGEERDQIYATPVPEKLQISKDYFLLQCFTGARIGDLMRLQKNTLQDNFLTYYTEKKVRKGSKKERIEIRVPLIIKAREIADKYSYIPDKLMPKISLKKINSDLKTIFTLAGVNRMITLTTPDGNEEVVTPINELITSHKARKTFIAGLYKKEVPIEKIASMTGHSPLSTALFRYFNIEDQAKIDALKLIE